jgi:hypothetical protein
MKRKRRANEGRRLAWKRRQKREREREVRINSSILDSSRTSNQGQKQVSSAAV